MAPTALSPLKSGEDHLPIEEIVFSCSVCQATVSEVYATTESNKGFHSGSGDDDGIVTKMWIAECSHITCAKHLENGAAPFHPKGLASQAPCPKCLKDKSDNDLKELYAIRGLGDGEYDEKIPSEWRHCPAIRLDSNVPGMSAVRFQYMALCHYARQARKHWKNALQRQTALETAYSKERKQRRELQSKEQELCNRVDELRNAEAQLRKWEQRKPMINHYLDTVGKMAKDIESMRNQLLQLGFHVPEVKYTYELEHTSAEKSHQPVEQQRDAPTSGQGLGGTSAQGLPDYAILE